MRKKTVTTIIVSVILTLATAGVGAALYLKEYRLHPPTYSVEEHRLERLKESAALWPDDWAERELVLHPGWTDEEAQAIRRMDAYLRLGYYEASVARNEHLKQQIASGIIEPCPCGFDVPYSDTALLLANKAKNAPVRLALLQLAATCKVDTGENAERINMALEAALCREWELSRALVRMGCSASTPCKGDATTLISHVKYADIPTEELIRFLEFFHQRGERIWYDSRDICHTACLRNTPQKIVHHGHGQRLVEESFLPAQGGGMEVLEWACDKGLLTELEWRDVLVIPGVLPLIQRFHRAGKFSLQVAPNQHEPTPVQEAVILAAPPIREGLSMDDILQKMEWMLENGADPNALPTRYSERGDRRFLPLAMCRRVLARADLQDRDAWLNMELLLLKHGAIDQ
ncbi:MAG: hypothetical protein IKZ07_00735 [Akkermansia sp.]|nr:hypothetical protein [Akkermansia sp.]